MTRKEEEITAIPVPILLRKELQKFSELLLKLERSAGARPALDDGQPNKEVFHQMISKAELFPGQKLVTLQCSDIC